MHDASANPDRSDSRITGLERLVAVIERLHREHTVSFIAAGDEKIYAYGGGGYVAIVSDRLFDGVVDIETPAGSFRIEPGEDGRPAVAAVGDGSVPTERDLEVASDGFERYYARRIGQV